MDTDDIEPELLIPVRMAGRRRFTVVVPSWSATCEHGEQGRRFTTVSAVNEEFGSAAVAIYSGGVDELASLLADDPALATRESTVGHPTLLQLVACEAAELPAPIDAARLLVDAGAATTWPLIAAAGCNSHAIVKYLLDRGADIGGDGSWSPLDEALYWANSDIAALLVARGASVRALSTAAGLGTPGLIDDFFDGDQLLDRAGPIGSPFPDTVPAEVAEDRQSIIDHAFVMAVNNGERRASERLLDRGAAINSKPPGFHWKGTALHAACWRGDRGILEWLLAHGADPTITDGLANSDAAGWARHHGHPELIELLS